MSRAAVALVVALVGCYRVPQPVCGFRCGPAGECPDGYVCVADDGRCHLASAPETVCTTAFDASIDQPLDGPLDAPPDAPPDAAIDAAIDAM